MPEAAPAPSHKLERYKVGLGELINADALEALKTIPNNSIDTIITDPPYGLSFMAKDWDKALPPMQIWKECIRVLKPGGIALIFGGPRTFHRLAVYIEDSGFILKDILMWLYGSGFPKAQDISRLIDERLGAERESIGKGQSGKSRKVLNGALDGSFGGEYDITAPATPEAKAWSGFKTTALKPAYEPIIMAMKPLSGTYAENALKWGVAGMNIKEARIGNDVIMTKGDSKGYNGIGLSGGVFKEHVGRFPANIILDPEAAAMLDSQAENSKSGPLGFKKIGWRHSNNTGEAMPILYQPQGFNDSGGPSRFFYVAKASPSERGDNPHPTVKPLSLIDHLVKLTKTPTGGVILDPFVGSGTTAEAAERNGRPWVGIDINKEYILYALERLKKWKGQSRLNAWVAER